MIMERKLGPGDVLPTEIQISEELQVSKSSVREAIKMLEALGVVEIRRGLCTVISKNPEQGYMNVMLSHFYLNSGNEEDLQNFRYIIESAYTTYAIHQATDNDLAAIREKLELFREKLRNGTLEAEDDILFHGQILQATHNSSGLHRLRSRTPWRSPPYNIIKSDGTTRYITGPFLFTKFYKKLRNHP